MSVYDAANVLATVTSQIRGFPQLCYIIIIIIIYYYYYYYYSRKQCHTKYPNFTFTLVVAVCGYTSENTKYVLCQELHNSALSPKSHLRVSFTLSTIRG